MAIGAIIGIGSSLIGGIGAGRAARKARRRQKRLLKQIEKLEANRQEIINPYAGVEGMLSNPFANLTVATQAAEMQAQQTDLSLASTLDTLRATGAGAGGATALAQAALSSKQGVAASIAQQEAQNERLRAQGEQDLHARRMAEQQRVQGIQISEGGRVQGMEMQGRQFQFQTQENREGEQLDRVSAQIAGSEARQAQASSDRTGAITGAIGGLTSIAGAYYGANS